MLVNVGATLSIIAVAHQLKSFSISLVGRVTVSLASMVAYFFTQGCEHWIGFVFDCAEHPRNDKAVVKVPEKRRVKVPFAYSPIFAAI